MYRLIYGLFVACAVRERLLMFIITNKSCMNPQDAVPGGDADDGSIFETERTQALKGDNSTDLPWSSTPVSLKKQKNAIHSNFKLNFDSKTGYTLKQ